MYRCFIFIILFWISLQTSANYNNFSFSRINVENGLSNNYVVDITQDKNGYIWIATESGLNRFDGHNISSYTTSNSKISSNELNGILNDTINNHIWIATQRNGLCVFDCNKQKFSHFFRTRNGMITNDVTYLSNATDGGLWVTHYHLGIDYFNREDSTFTAFRIGDIKGMKGHFWCAKDDGKGNLYIGQQEDGMSIINLKNKTIKYFIHNEKNPNSIPGNCVKSILIDSKDNIWVGTDNGLALFNNQTEKFTVFRHDPNNKNSIISNIINDIKETTNGDIWICTEVGGVSIISASKNKDLFLGEGDSISFLNIKDGNDRYGLSSPNVRRFFEDSFGNIWLGNYQGGVDILSYNPSPFHLIGTPSLKDYTITHNQVWGICIDKENNLWTGEKSEIKQYSERTFTQKIDLSKISKTNTHVTTIYKDSKGLLWLGMYQDGILIYDTKNKTTRRITLDNNNINVNTFHETPDNTMWIGTDSGIYSYKGGKIIKEDIINSQLWDNMIRSIESNSKYLWIGTFGQGLFIINKEKKLVYHFDKKKKFPSNAINHLYKDNNGSIWAATRNGLIYFENSLVPNKFTVYKHNGINNNNIKAIIEDNNGEIWVSTNKGISHFNKSDKTFFNYVKYEDIPKGSFIEASACKDKNGILFFGSQEGVCYFNPNEIKYPQNLHKVKIISVQEYGVTNDNIEKLSEIKNKSIELDYNENTLKISFSVIDFTLSKQIEYAYNIDDKNNVWFNLGNKNEIILHDLKPGKYTLNIKAWISNKSEICSYETLHITVNPPIWLTWYAKTIYVILSIAIIFIGLRLYIRKLNLEHELEIEQKKHENEQRLNSERANLYTQVTHEIRTPLTLIVGPIEDLKADEYIAKRYSKKIEYLQTNTQKLLDMVNQILDFRKIEAEKEKLNVEKSDLAVLIKEITNTYKDINYNKNVEINVEINTENTILYFDKKIIRTIINNLLSNALKYTPSGYINLKLYNEVIYNINYTCIKITDTGYGISAEALKHIFEYYYQENKDSKIKGTGIGLAIVKALSELHNIKIEVDSQEGKGTSFTLMLETDNKYEEDNTKKITTIDTNNFNNENPTLLIVEDNKDINDYISESLMDSFNIVSASNGKEGFEKAIEIIPDIIMSDIMMPITDGIELCKLIKNNINTCHIPFILLSAKSSFEEKELGYKAGADSYITKPFSIGLIKSRINNILDNRRKIAEITAENLVTIKNQKENSENESIINELDNKFLEKLKNIILQNIGDEKINVTFIAERMCMSHSTLYRKVKGVTNLNINEFVKKIKLQKSVELLKCKKYTITEIADMTGFSSVAYFRQCFKDEYGLPPSDIV